MNPHLERATTPAVALGDGYVLRVLDNALDEVLDRRLQHAYSAGVLSVAAASAAGASSATGAASAAGASAGASAVASAGAAVASTGAAGASAGAAGACAAAAFGVAFLACLGVSG